MTKRIAKSFVDSLLARVDIVSTINARVPLKKAGKDMQACCPFHEEKTPSFTVSGQKGFYYCFGCHAKGDAIGFLMAYEHLSFVEAVEKLAEENHIKVEYEQFDGAKAKRQHDLFDVLASVSSLYERQLFDVVGKKACEYLNQRQLDEETVRFFRLGYAEADNHLLARFAGQFSQEALVRAGVLGQGDDGRYYDRFRQRLMFPIRDARGRVVGFGARTLGDAKPKYLNSSENEVFSKRHVLYGLYEELQSNRHIDHLIVVEGYMDVIALRQMGVSGAVAALGTALTPEHIDLAHRYTKKIYICFDGDNAGKKAAQRAMDTILPVMQLGMEVRVVFLPDDEDPDTLVRKTGKTAFIAKLQSGQHLSEFVFDTLIDDSDLKFVEGRGEVAKRARALFERLPETDYKKMLYQQLTDFVGMDIYHLGQRIDQGKQKEQPQVLYSSSTSLLSSGRRRTQGRAEKLIRLLLEMPDLSRYGEHLQVLLRSDDDEHILLARLIQFLQLRSGKAEERRRAVFASFSTAQSERIRSIYRAGELVDDVKYESVEKKYQRFKNEFVMGLQTLINQSLRKKYFARA